MKLVRVAELLVLGLVSLVSCSGGADDDRATAQGAGTELPAPVRDRLTWLPPRVPPEVAVTGEEILVVGGLDADSEGFVRIPESALLVDRAAGTLVEVPAPRSDTSVNVIDAVGDASGFVIVGLRCDDAGLGLGRDDYECSPGSGASFRLDPDTATWSEVSLPAEVSPDDPDRPWVFQPELGTGRDGRIFMIVRAGPTGPGELPFRLLFLEGDQWVRAADLSTELYLDVCAASDGVYVLSRSPGAAVAEAPPSPALRLVKVAFDGGAPVPVDLPELDTSFDAAAVAMACDKHGPYVTSSRPDPDAELVLHGLRGGAWRQIEGDWGNAIPLEVHSAAEGIVLVNDTPSDSGRFRRAFVVGDTSETARALGGDSASRQYTADPVTGGFVALGPLPALAAGAEPSVPRGSDSLTASTVDP